MCRINELGWIKKQFIEHNPDNLKESYIFTVDGKLLEYNGFQPLGLFDVETDALLRESREDVDKCPPVACCSCGCIECDSVRTFVEFKDNFVAWTIFEANICSDIESVMKENMGKYIFSKEQYLQAINSLTEAVEKDELISKQKKLEGKMKSKTTIKTV